MYFCDWWAWVRWTHRRSPGGCFTNVSQALQDILLKFVYCRNRHSYENFKLKLWTCAQSMALGTRTKFQLENLTINVISGIVYFREIILESSRNVSETTPRISHAYITFLRCQVPSVFRWRHSAGICLIHLPLTLNWNRSWLVTGNERQNYYI